VLLRKLRALQLSWRQAEFQSVQYRQAALSTLKAALHEVCSCLPSTPPACVCGNDRCRGPLPGSSGPCTLVHPGLCIDLLLI
jgi:hypothetical protein